MRRLIKTRAGQLMMLVIPLLMASVGCERTGKIAAGQAGAEWRDLFDGETLRGWTGVNGTRAGEAWQVIDGNLVLTAGGAGDLITTEQFADFDLTLEWKISPGGNSGIIYRVASGDAPVWMSGMEYQILDNSAFPNLEKPSHSAGAVFDLYAPSAAKAKPAGQYNKTRIRLQDGQVEHWLNGTRIVSYRLWSIDWKARFARSKFSNYPEFARSKKGHIALQDHGDKVWYRKIKIRRL
ncbi:3-keto-disaccharide hydrolase [Microbulbifer spongiae]|uniref:DUF1080 domain-containing protein n=1 Tax=Microbulbifer spongiae TaxID=2944933 RepID=A0ABY9EGR4_9GAMM|nr:DUF1080 domain-containing protein [Microbulbifer sp. MI-G]WKD51472.1 DUF1080 domain-containing protein [Microbulbifer sp. MI-G]